MTTSVESITTAAISAALQAATSRQGAISANLANLNAEGHVPLRVAFGTRLEEARAVLQDKGVLDANSIEGLRGEMETVLDTSGQPAKVQLDEQMAELARNAVHYQALAQGISRHLAIQALAAADGKK